VIFSNFFLKNIRGQAVSVIGKKGWRLFIYGQRRHFSILHPAWQKILRSISFGGACLKTAR
jgi:hypothetical protein